MSNCQNTLVTAAIAGLVGSMAREVSTTFLHPVLSWLARQFPFHGREEPEESLRVIRLLDEICERGKSVKEAELLEILGISKKRLRHLWKQDNTIRPGYTMEPPIILKGTGWFSMTRPSHSRRYKDHRTSAAIARIWSLGHPGFNLKAFLNKKHHHVQHTWHLVPRSESAKVPFPATW